MPICTINGGVHQAHKLKLTGLIYTACILVCTHIKHTQCWTSVFKLNDRSTYTRAMAIIQ